MVYHKVKTGCRECKRRRIKCPEERPCCSRCLRSKRQCEYAPVQEAVSRPAKRRAIDEVALPLDKDAMWFEDKTSGSALIGKAHEGPQLEFRVAMLEASEKAQKDDVGHPVLDQFRAAMREASSPRTPSLVLSVSTGSSPTNPLSTPTSGPDEDVQEIYTAGTMPITADEPLDTDFCAQIGLVAKRRARHVSPNLFVNEVSDLIEHYLAKVGPSFAFKNTTHSYAFIWTTDVVKLASQNQLIQDAILMMAAADLFYRTDDKEHECKALKYKGRVLTGLVDAVETDKFPALVATMALASGLAGLGERWLDIIPKVHMMKRIVNDRWKDELLSLAQITHLIESSKGPMESQKLQYRLFQWYAAHSGEDDPEFYRVLFKLLSQYADPDAGLHAIARSCLERYLELSGGEPGLAADLLARFPEDARIQWDKRKRKQARWIGRIAAV
ncbi:hypothetical protein PYCC9005_005563 [Savitreella phatthalungensis]